MLLRLWTTGREVLTKEGRKKLFQKAKWAARIRLSGGEIEEALVVRYPCRHPHIQNACNVLEIKR